MQTCQGICELLKAILFFSFPFFLVPLQRHKLSLVKIYRCVYMFIKYIDS